MRLGRRTFGRLLAWTGLAYAGCDAGDRAKQRAAAAPGAPAATRPGSLRYLALGDSYTIGESVETAERWPVQLTAALRAAGFDIAGPEIIARTGWRTDNLDAAITKSEPKGPYALVSLLIGVNDQFQSRPAEEYRERFSAMLKRAIDLAGADPGRLLVLSIPDWSFTLYGQDSGPERITKQIDAFNAINRAAAEQAGVRYVDVTPVSRLGLQQPDLVAADGLHPSGKQYTEWTKLALPAAKAALTPAAAASAPATRGA